ncbi:hypothetical protein HYALB_00001118 [Hymenoscyphus albidus]|uniref:SOK1 protein n=1 Tax=Hymenoscyphus albidus TaxID=595503 RepID=A0A9N9LHH3_9HELO|nr:hypothetical protein HYALB_00001118 [Hymenoscyphus albidus]
MEPDSGRGRGNSNSIAPANGRTGISSNNEGASRDAPPNRSQSPDSNQGEPMATPEEESKRQLDIMGDAVDQSYGIKGQNESNQIFGGSPPRDPRLFPSTSNTEKPSKPNNTLEPPVTKTTLSELDVNKIVHNPRLRHDINFDPDLHFRPNLDGEKGRKKTQKSSQFWDTMREQLLMYLTRREEFEAQIGNDDWSLPSVLNAIRGILETLVPQRDRASVEETFNVELLMQQFRMGVADLVKLATWLSQLLKCHCAPMRDDWVDEMVTQLSNGDRNGDVTLLVAGMQNLLGVLEAMKLDVANHQIRCLRPLLIEDTVHFEQKYFMKKIAMRKLELAESHAWYGRASCLPDVIPLDSSMQSQVPTWNFMKALVALTLPSRGEAIPQTFAFDEDRMVKFRTDMQDLINFEICMFMYRGLETQNRQEARIAREDTPNMSATSSPFFRPASPADNTMLSSPTIPSPHHFTSRTKLAAQERGHFIRTLTGRQIWIPNVEDDMAMSSADSSPNSSPTSIASDSELHIPTPFYLSVPVSDTSIQARTSLQAILASVTTADKWNTLHPALALEILRLTNTSLTRLPQFESHLAFHISNPSSRYYQEAEQRVLSQLFPVLQKLVTAYTPLTSVQIFDAAVGPKSGPGNSQTQAAGAKAEIDEVATRIAHMGILHWRVWAPLAYLVNPDAEEQTDMNTIS